MKDEPNDDELDDLFTQAELKELDSWRPGEPVPVFLRDERLNDPKAASEWVQGELERLLPKTSKIERTVISLRFGFPDASPKSYDEIAQVTNLNRNRVIEILEAFYDLMVHPARQWSLQLWREIDEEFVAEDFIKSWDTAEINGINPNLFKYDINVALDSICRFAGTEENGITSIWINPSLRDEKFPIVYGHRFDSSKLDLDSIYEQICSGYFRWSDELCYFSDYALRHWNDTTGYFDEYSCFPRWRQKVSFIINLFSLLSNSDSLEIASNYFMAAPEENFLSSLLPFEIRNSFKIRELIDGFKKGNLEIPFPKTSSFLFAARNLASATKKEYATDHECILRYLSELCYSIYAVSWREDRFVR